jgi:hypothetical protein
MRDPPDHQAIHRAALPGAGQYPWFVRFCDALLTG